MSQYNNRYVVLDKEMLDQCFKTLGNLLKKRSKASDKICELVVVGGASIVLNYGFRLTTMDIDCLDEQRILMNEVVNIVAEKYNLPSTWINTDFMNTKSYSYKLTQYSIHYGSFGNGVLEVRTIKDEYLLAMKVVSGRKYKNDYSDIYGVIFACYQQGNAITIEQLDKAIINLYNSFDVIDIDAYEFAKKIINNPNVISYDDILSSEKDNATLIKAKAKNNIEQEEIEYILSKLEID